MMTLWLDKNAYVVVGGVFVVIAAAAAIATVLMINHSEICYVPSRKLMK